jgi:phosphoribosylcarboxyaminoimidazole (NCAIR) mutase
MPAPILQPEPSMNLSALQAALAVVVAVTASVVLATTAAPAENAERLAAALTAPADDRTSVRLEVIRAEGEDRNELVVVAVQGGDEAARLERAARVRQQLAALGVPTESVFIEGAEGP